MSGMVIATLAAKLSLSVAAFLLLGYFGRFYDRRVTGVLLTFPILNVIGLLSAGEPRRAAQTICVVVIWNTLPFVAILTWLARKARGPSQDARPRSARPRMGRAVACRRGRRDAALRLRTAAALALGVRSPAGDRICAHLLARGARRADGAAARLAPAPRPAAPVHRC